MNAANELTVAVDDLAGHWTDRLLESLKAAGIRHVSVGMEIATWQILKKLLKSELYRHQLFRVVTRESLGELVTSVLRRTAVLIAQKFEPESVTSEFLTRVRQAAGDRRSTTPHRREYADLIRRSALRLLHSGRRAERMSLQGLGPRWQAVS